MKPNTYKASSCQEQKYPLTEKGYCKNFFRHKHGVAATDSAMPTWFPRNRFAESCSAPNTYWGYSAISARGFCPHREEHSYPHAGRSKDGLIPIGSGRPVTREARGRGSARKTVVNAPPYL